jgi:hypothetical protein
MNPVSTFRTITCDSGRTALFESTTFPPRLAVVYCADAAETDSTKTPVAIDHDVGDRIEKLLKPRSSYSEGERAETRARKKPVLSSNDIHSFRLARTFA